MNGHPSSSLGKDVSMGFANAYSGIDASNIVDRMSNTSMRWQSNHMPQNVRMSKTRGWITEPQTMLDSVQSRDVSQVNKTARHDLGYSG